MIAGRLAARNVLHDRAGAHEATLALVERPIACSARPPLDELDAPQPPGAPLPTAAPKRSSPTVPLIEELAEERDRVCQGDDDQPGHSDDDQR
jgi:hypothetical protein